MAAIEITTFRLMKGHSIEEFIAANADIDIWLKRQPGFRLRRIAVQDDGTIVDSLLWDSTAQAEESMHRLMDEMRDSPVHGMIDQRTVSWGVSSVMPCHPPRLSGTAGR
ncbi:hypothetical protein AB4120_16745 [Cupriavidus sp. 2KB_3]|uniref:hypothetical protein n=1 Tax=Cupriavidus TaxID=106589 RepID=UPI0021CCA835|nr:hypothetical protein [Cupriavidus campinensis]